MYLNSLTLDINKLRFFDRPSASKVMVHAFRKTSQPTPEGGLPLLRCRVSALHIACLQVGETAKKQSYRLPKPVLQMDVLRAVF